METKVKATPIKIITECEYLITDSDRTKHLLSLLFDEITEMQSAVIEKDATNALICCSRADTYEALLAAVYDNVEKIRNALENIVKNNIPVIETAQSA